MGWPGVEEDRWETPPLFEACKGIRFYVGKNEMSLAAGHYQGGGGAIVVMSASGEPECKLTVNLTTDGDMEEPPPLDQFWVKIEDEYTDNIRATLLKTGLFGDAGERRGAGYQKFYAARWRFAFCGTPIHHSGYGQYAVLCAGCRQRIADTFGSQKTIFDAEDTVRRLKNRKTGDL